MTTTYTDVFGGANIYPAEVSYSELNLDASVTLHWPDETGGDPPFATSIIDVLATGAGLGITLPAADSASTGETILLNNLGAYTVTVYDAAAVQVVTLAPGTLWQVYLADNSTAAGTWRSLQYGASLSQANASALAGTGIVAVGTLLSQSVPVTAFNSNYSAGATDRAKMFNWNGAGGTLTLPVPASVGNNWFIYLRNSGSGAVSVDPSGSVMIDDALTKSFQPGDSAIIASDGLNYFTIGFGQQAIFAFDYTVIDVAGTGDYTLAGAELNRIAYSFIGALTGNRDIIVPVTVQQYWVTNNTTGPYLLTVKTATGLGISVAQGESSIMYCNGVDVVNASTGGLSVPISIAQGGTAATTAGSALINLGGTSTGISLFTAADEVAAYAALGVAPAGVVEGGAF